MKRIEARAGVSIAYRDDWFGPPWEDKETVLLIHGIAESGEAWVRWVPDLSSRFRVIRIDLPGFGASTAPPDYDWTPDTLAADLSLFLDRLELDRVHIVGAKYGGTVGMRFACNFPDRVQSLAIFGSPASVPAVHYENGRAIQDSVRLDRKEWVERSMRRRLGTTVPQAQVDWWIDLMLAADLRAFVGATTAVADLSLLDDLHKITARSLIVTTQESGLQSVAAVKAYQERIRDSRLVVLPGDGYHVAASSPHKCTAHYLAFIDGRTQGHAVTC